MMNKNKIKNERGYTLIELIVSISIIIIISSMMLANYRQGGASEELNAAAQNLVSEIRKVQAYSLGYKEFNGSIPDEGGWGIALTSVSTQSPENFILFFDYTGATPSGPNDKYNSPTELYVSNKIGKNVEVDELIFNNGASSENYFWAIFFPPDPIVNLNGDINPGGVSMSVFDANEVEVVLRHISGRSKSIILNKYGVVDGS